MKKKWFFGVLFAGVLFGMAGCNSKTQYSSLDTMNEGKTEAVLQTENTENKTDRIYTRNDVSAARIGDYVVFGSYEQDNNVRNGKEQIEWIVLDEKDGKKLLISNYILDTRVYDEATVQTWDKSSLRAWLNEDFYDEAFSEKDRLYIASTNLHNPDNKHYESLVKPYSTTDVIFLLGAEEAEAYKNSEATAKIMTREAVSTPYARARGLRDFQWEQKDTGFWYYLRSCGYHDSYAALLSAKGTVDRGGISINEEGLGIRPVLWICTEPQKNAPSYVPGELLTEDFEDNNDIKNNEQGNKGDKAQEDVKQEEPDKQESRPKSTPTPKPTSTPKPTPTPKPTSTPTPKPNRYVMFGSYEQDNNPNNGKEAIEWLVLEEKDGKALLVSRYILDANHVEDFYSIWEKRPIRTWLNENFYNEAFSEQEKKSVIETKVTNPDNDGYDVPASETKELVFLLSVNEVKRYFGENDSIYGNSKLATSATPYAVAQGVQKMEYGGVGDGNSEWDLRSNGYHDGYAAWVSDTGETYAGGHAQASNRGIRPAIVVVASEIKD